MSTGDGESDSEHDNVNFLSPPRDNKLTQKCKRIANSK